ncbi:MBL fold metallo-hydrolase [Halalkalibacterium halodurans]|uniref:MBL fold metallo-hydrolase n=1 Tax=Halalkalibacterium halodurans TaxID=86665 RepID=UPI002AA9C20C|nr:MBL fold metallo-hydrolase [Halalkalibacterium halodurans]MDY7220974.1 MBL fold metallo-hydrolase [Halalkalibacterium halodurans]MDY7240213.1 MBL fold metallo-hydrolase [Halalkalibacterium halodurans]
MTISLRKLSDRVYYFPSDAATDRPVLAIIYGEGQSLMIDAGNSNRHARTFLESLKAESLPMPSLAVLTHWHWDHVFGLRELRIPAVAHTRTYEALRRMQPLSWDNSALDKRVEQGEEIAFCAEMIKREFGEMRDIDIVLPTITFHTKIELDLGGVRGTVEHVGGDHAPDSSVIYLEEEKVLFLGDALYPNLYARNPEYTVNNMRGLLNKVRTYQADTYVLSHQEPLDKLTFFHYIDVLQRLCDLTERYQGEREPMRAELQQIMGQKVDEIFLEAFTCFVNGALAEEEKR